MLHRFRKLADRRRRLCGISSAWKRYRCVFSCLISLLLLLLQLLLLLLLLLLVLQLLLLLFLYFSFELPLSYALCGTALHFLLQRRMRRIIGLMRMKLGVWPFRNGCICDMVKFELVCTKTVGKLGRLVSLQSTYLLKFTIYISKTLHNG